MTGQGGHGGADLTAVSVGDLTTLLRRVESGRTACPLTQAALLAAGLGHLADKLAALHGLDSSAVAAVLRLVIADRENHTCPELELVWTGPEPDQSECRNTAVVVANLFRQAQEHVLIAGYTFDHGADILAPLHEAMVARGVQVQIILNTQRREGDVTPAQELANAAARRFLKGNWPFDEPLPVFHHDPRTLSHEQYVSMHAKCMVVDRTAALITSANFTDRGQGRNIEAGILIKDDNFAKSLLGHWQRLIADAFLREARP